MHSYLKLFPRIFVNKRRTVDRIFFYFSRQRHRTDNDCVITRSCVYNLFYRVIDNFTFVCSDPYAKPPLAISHASPPRLGEAGAGGFLFFNRNFWSFWHTRGFWSFFYYWFFCSLGFRLFYFYI